MLAAKPMSSELKRYQESLFRQGEKREFGALSLPWDISIGFDLEQNLGRDQSAYLDHRGCGANFAEEFSMRLADFLPLRNVGYKHSRAHHILHAGAGFLQGALDVFQYLHGLGVRISHAHNVAVRPRGGGARDMDIRSNPHSTRVTHNRFTGCAAGDVHSFHGSISSLAIHSIALNAL